MKEIRAKDIMTTEVIKIPADMPLTEASEMFVEKMISGAPVVNDEDKVVGVVSLTDLARAAAEEMHVIKEKVKESTEYYTQAWEIPLADEDWQNLHVESYEGLTVEDIMTPIIFSVTEDAPLEEIVEVMLTAKLHRLLVTKDDQIVGIITTTDILKIIPQLLKEIREK